MKNVIGNERAIKYLKQADESGNVSHAYLFHGPESVGKTLVAVEFARRQLCAEGAAADCKCRDCSLIAANSHPDLILLDGVEAGIEEIREVSAKLELKPYQAHSKVAIISHADRLSVPAMNAFLKTLEEPADRTMIILTAENINSILPTIISRSRLLSFTTIGEKEVFTHLNQEAGIPRELAAEIAAVSGGRLGYALSLTKEPERARSIIAEGQEYYRIYRSQSISDKISLAARIAAEKTDLVAKLSGIVLYLRKLLLESVEKKQQAAEVTLVASAIDDLTVADRLIKANINPRLALETALFRSISR